MHFTALAQLLRQLSCSFLLIFLLSSQLIGQCDRQQDSLSLVALYNATSGPSWNVSWDLSQEMSTWYGITLTSEGCVLCIDLDGYDNCGEIPLAGSPNTGNGLIGELPASFYDLTVVEFISMQRNSISGNLSSSISNFDSLRIINFLQNDLSGNFPTEIGLLKKLTRVIFAQNNFSGSFPIEFGDLPVVTSLSFGSNNFTGTIPKELGQCKQLGFLSIEANDLEGEIPPELGNATSLWWLRLNNNNNLEGEIPSTFSELTNMRRMSLGTNRLSGNIPDFIGNWTELEELHLNSNQFSGNIPPSLTQLSKLKSLILFRNNLTGHIPSGFSGLEFLETFAVNENNLGTCFPEDLLDICDLGFGENPYADKGYNFLNNPLLPFEGDYSRICDGEPQLGAPCNDGDDSNGTDDVILADCSCGPELPKIDTDGDGVVDEIDLDDDNDGILDIVEGFCYATPVILATECASASGAGMAGIPKLSIDLPAGSGDSRFIFVSISSERDHGPDGLGGNWETNLPISGDFQNDTPPVTLGNTELEIGSYHYSMYGASNMPENANHSITNYNYYSFIAPSLVGPTTLDLSRFAAPLDEGDEMVVTATLFEGVRDYEYVDGASIFGDTIFSLTSEMESQFQTAGTESKDNLLLSVSASSNESGMEGNWDSVVSCDVNNPNGTIDITIMGTESDGMSMRTQMFTGVDGLQTSEFYVNGPSQLFSVVTNFRIIGCALTDSDNDGIVDHLDSDSDNDGCPDAVEGDGIISLSQLEDGMITGGVNPQTGIPLEAGPGQGLGTSAMANLQDPDCNLTELCDNGIDDDGDGLIDCDDPDLVDDCCCYQSLISCSSIGESCNGSNDGSVMASGGVDYLWDTGDNTAMVAGLAPGIYAVTVTNANGCTATCQSTISAGPAPTTPSFSFSVGYCQGMTTDALPPTSDNGITGTWSPAAIDNTVSGAYTFTPSAGECATVVTIFVVINPNPRVEISGSSEYCLGGSTILDVGANFASSFWSTGESSSVISVSTPGSYSVTVTDSNACTDSAAVTVSETASLNPTIAGDLEFCGGESTLLNAGSNFASYMWSTGDATQTISVENAGTYSVTVTDASGCTGSAFEFVNEIAGAEIEIAGDLEICSGQSTTLNAGTGFVAFSWSTGEISPSISSSTPGTYSVTVTDQNGCTSSSAVAVTEIAESDEITDASICDGENYTWLANGLIYSSAGTYAIETQTNGGCIQKQILNLEVLPSDDEIRNITICAGEVYSIDGEAFDMEGQYVVSSNSGGLCETSITLNLVVSPVSSRNIERTICEGESTDFGGNFYTVSGQYPFTFTSSNGCDSTVTLELSVEQSVVETENYNIDTGGSVTVNGQTYTTGGQYSQTLGSGTCDTTLVINITETKSLLYYDFNACSAEIGVDNFDYSEFTAVHNTLDCGTINASTVYRDNPMTNMHSCTPGMNNSISMCISSEEGCGYIAGSEKSAKLMINVTPDAGATIELSKISFYQKAPLMFDWINGNSALNNYPRLYGVRVLVNNSEVFVSDNNPTNSEWTLEELDLDGVVSITSASTVTIELLGYCLIGNGQDVSAWDLEDLRVYGACDLTASRIISGHIKTVDSKVVEDVLVVRYDNQKQLSTTSDNTGSYTFGQSYLGEDYQVKSHKNSDHLNGVSTLDLVTIQRHVLGIEPLSHPTKFVAADVNNDDNINGQDLVELKKLILGLYDQFPQNTSYKFLDSDKIESEISPWTIPEYKLCSDLAKHEMQVDFTAVKIGDVNDSAIHSSSQLEIRNEKRKNLSYRINTVEGISTADFYLEELDGSIQGLQLSMAGLSEISGISSEQLALSSGDYRVDENDILKLSWVTASDSWLDTSIPLFSIELAGQDTDAMELTDSGISSEVYSGNQAYSLDLKKHIPRAELLTDLLVSPNPFKDQTQVSFDLVREAVVAYKIYSNSGQLISENQLQMNRGQQALSFSREELTEQGIYHMILSVEGQTFSRQLIITD